MIILYYAGILLLSLICSMIYIYIWHKHFDVNFNMIFTLVPFACVGYLMLSLSESLGEALVATKIIYFCSCYLQFFILFSILNLCQINVDRKLRLLLFTISAVLFASVLSIGYSDIFYRSVTFDIVAGVPVLHKEYGWMHSVYYVSLIIFFAIGLFAIGFSLIRKKQVPRTVIALLLIPDMFSVFSFFVLRRLITQVDPMPAFYLLAQIMYIIIVNRINLYDVSDTAIDSLVREKSFGYISFDFKYRYLGSDETACMLVPELRELSVDDVFGYKPAERRIRHYLDSFKKNPENNQFAYTLRDPDGDPDNERIYSVSINYLYDGNRKCGYFVTFTDDTANRKYIRLLDSYNDQLKQEVEEKTQSVIEMHDNLIMSLAMMVESRDNSTGGHIKRTSEGVRILIDAIREEGELKLNDEFCKDVIKAAPMHDLGKIAVDDAVLRKPGRFTDEEYEKMKHHSAEGARVIHEILLHTNDNSFKKVAENVAHYHHERWDGSGYPEHLSGEKIPLEARIMAIADVYDALVSKRVYKDAFSFEKADTILMEGMGTQFDPGLRHAYIKARPKLEAYYSNFDG